MQKKAIKRRHCDVSKTEFKSSLHPVLQRVYCGRNITHVDQIGRELIGLLPPNKLKGIDRAAELLAKAVREQWRILIIGDFDADGATSSALAVSALKAFGANHVDYLVPNRFEFGYGLTPEIVEVATSFSPDVIITVDNGISSVSGVAAAKEYGIKVLVTDHHLAGDSLPNADVIVNPNQPGCDFPSKNLAGVGVIFYVMTALRSLLRTENWFAENNLVEPNMASFLDLVALGTVADVVPLDENNRILVYQGLQRIKAGFARPGILALLEVGKRQRQRLVASDLGFAVGPRLNAAGRLDDMSLGINCLLTTDPFLAKEMASQLDELNQDRKNIEVGMQREAMAALKPLHLNEGQLPFGICMYDENWHQGVIGILASRIKDRYHRPVIAFADAGNGEIKGSARSIDGLHIRDVLDAVAVHHPGLLTKFGGHAMAAGMSLLKENFEQFRDAFDGEIRRLLTAEAFEPDIVTDGELSSADINAETAHTIREGGPWGQAFPEPLFDGVFLVLQQRLVAERHLKLVLAPLNNKQAIIDAIQFNADLEIWPDSSIEMVRLAYRLDINEYRGEQNVQLMVEYIEKFEASNLNRLSIAPAEPESILV